MSGNKVLLIEQNQDNLNFLQQLVKQSGFSSVSAQSLAEAQHLYNQSLPEDFLCSVVNYSLPDAAQGEAVDYTLDVCLPTIALSDDPRDELREKIMAKSIVDYIHKENLQIFDYLQRLLVRLKKNPLIGVLVVEDSRLVRNQVMSLLRRHNYDVFEAQDGAQGLTCLREHPNIKLVITDENMPNMTGVEMLAEIRKQYTKDEVAVIGISAVASCGQSSRFLKSGANDYLNKPFNHEEFFCRVTQNIEYLESIKAVQRAANTDYLTGLPNRRFFFSHAEAVLRSDNTNVCVAMLDLDHFKNVNDTFGHDAGDKVIKTVAKTLLKFFKNHLIARFGGEEFCIFFATDTAAETSQKLNDFREAFSQYQINSGQDEIKISCTVSIGLCTEWRGTLQKMLDVADRYLYLAKNSGRNRLCSDLTDKLN